MKKEKYKIGAPGKTVIGLTGPIASGKSLALSYFKKHGAFCVSADALAASLLTEPPCYNRILRKFGPEILLKNGFLDKKRLAAEVFGSAAKRKWLERLLHPVILKETHSLITKSHKKFAVVEAPLLFEAGLAECFALNLCLYAPERTLEARALGRGWTRAQYRARRSAQMPAREKYARAAVVLDNSGDPAALERSVKIICSFLKNI